MELKVANSDGTLLSAGSICVRLLVSVCVRLYLRLRAFACICVCMRLRESAFACACVRSSVHVYARVFCGHDTNLKQPSRSEGVRETELA